MGLGTNFLKNLFSLSLNKIKYSVKLVLMYWNFLLQLLSNDYER